MEREKGTMELKFTKASELKQKPQDETQLGFGQIFSDYMFLMRYTEGRGWHDAEIKQYEPFLISPAATVFHYAQEVFEGLKAYHCADGSVNLFRPTANFARMSASAKRLAMPEYDEAFANKALKELVSIERGWIPESEGTSLYLRPNYIGVDPYVGVRAAREYIFYIICGPVGAYYAHGLAPTKILIEKVYTRSSPGGMGFAKTGGNYAASLIAGEEAHQKGCDQVLWLDAQQRKFVEEVGSMNIMFVIDGVLVTPPLNGTILPGITRDSVLTIARQRLQGGRAPRQYGRDHRNGKVRRHDRSVWHRHSRCGKPGGRVCVWRGNHHRGRRKNGQNGDGILSDTDGYPIRPGRRFVWVDRESLTLRKGV